MDISGTPLGYACALSNVSTIKLQVFVCLSFYFIFIWKTIWFASIRGVMFSNSICMQVTRVYKGTEHAEVEYNVSYLLNTGSYITEITLYILNF